MPDTLSYKLRDTFRFIKRFFSPPFQSFEHLSVSLSVLGLFYNQDDFLIFTILNRNKGFIKKDDINPACPSKTSFFIYAKV